MYHERALQEGCASPPPAVLSQHNTKSSHYYNIVRFILLNWILVIFEQKKSETLLHIQFAKGKKIKLDFFVELLI